MTPKTELLKTRDFGEIITDTFLFIRENLKPLLKSFFILCGFFIAASAVFSVLQQIKMVNEINVGFAGRGTMFGRPNPFAFFGIEYFLSLFFVVMSYIALQVTVYSYICLYKEKGNEPPTPIEVWGYFKYYYIKIFLSGIVLTLLLMVGLMLCIVPGIYLYPILSLVFPIMIFENTSFGYAFSRSFKLIKENWWLTFGSIVIMIIIVYVASFVILLPATIINAGSLFTHLTRGGGGQVSVVATVITTILGSICHVFYILPTVTVSLCYFNLTEHIDSTGLIARIGQIGDTSAENNLPGEEY